MGTGTGNKYKLSKALCILGPGPPMAHKEQGIPCHGIYLPLKIAPVAPLAPWGHCHALLTSRKFTLQLPVCQSVRFASTTPQPQTTGSGVGCTGGIGIGFGGGEVGKSSAHPPSRSGGKCHPTGRLYLRINARNNILFWASSKDWKMPTNIFGSLCRLCATVCTKCMCVCAHVHGFALYVVPKTVVTISLLSLWRCSRGVSSYIKKFVNCYDEGKVK